MRKVTVIVSKDQLTNFLTYAGEQGLLHLVAIPEANVEGSRPYETAPLLAKSATVRNRLQTAPPALRARTETDQGHTNAHRKSGVDHLAEYLDKETFAWEQKVKQIDTRAEKLQEETERYVQLSRLLAGLEKLGVSLDNVSGTGFTAIIAGEVPAEGLESARTELDRLSYGNVIFALTGSSEKGEQFFAVMPSAFQEEAKQSLTTLGARLESGLSGLASDPSVARKEVDQKLDETRSVEKSLRHEREELLKEFAPKYGSLSVLAEILDLRTEALSNALSTESTVMLQAWIPKPQLENFSKGAAAACNGEISIQTDARAGERMAKGAHEHSKELIPETIAVQEAPPSLVEIPSWLKPLQSIVNNFGAPSYHEMNPLPFMILTYPIIYGLMFGDVGLGILFTLGGLTLWNLKRKGKKIFELGQMIEDGAELVVMLGIGTIVFGIIFGDFFGINPIPGFLLLNNGHPIFSPDENKIVFMVITLFVGVLHLGFGLTLSAVNKVKNKEYAHALFGPVSWLVFYLSAIYLISNVVLANFHFGVALHSPQVYFFIPLIVPLGLMAWKEGGLHMFEAFLSSASNTLSYLRIWALNIADFELKAAMVIALGGIIGLVIGNALVLIIEGLIVFVQTLRLHWVEWFSKFYEGTGVTFAPYREPLTIGIE